MGRDAAAAGRAALRRARRLIRGSLRRLGYDLIRARPPWPPDFQAADVELIQAVAPYTMTTPDAVYALADAVRYTVAHAIPGAVAECGVWRGGSRMAVAKTLLEAGRFDVDLYLFDTFEGMSAPTDIDVCWTGERAGDLLARTPPDGHEHVHLYPRLAPGGVLILDDYGWWRGAAEATDEYFREHPPAPLLVRVDDGGTRIAVKPT